MLDFSVNFLALYIKQIEKQNEKILSVVPKTRLEKVIEY